MVRRLLFFVALVVSIGLVAEAAPASAAVDPASAEREFVVRINELRAGLGIAPLTTDAGLTAMAREWAGTMAAAGQIFHRPNLAAAAPDPTWIKLGENVGVGPSVQALHDAFVASPAHYRNLVDPEFREVGIGVVLVGDPIYVAENFMRTELDAASPAPTLTAAAPSASTPAVKAASKPCTTRKCRAAARARAKAKARAKSSRRR